MTIELYVFPPSPRAFKVIALANHVGVDWQLRMLNMMGGEHRHPDYAAMNPNMRMPTLKHGDYVLWEGNAINQYLASLKPESGVLPCDDRGRIDVTRWQFWDLAHFDPACAIFMFEYVVKPLMGAGPPDVAAVAKGAELFHRAAAVLDKQLAGKRYVTGEQLTLADFSLGSDLIYGEDAHFPLQDYKEIRRWYDSLCELPAWQAALDLAGRPVPIAA
jgi:glutathione S-transferase